MKNRCAWLNHSSNAGAFISLVHRYPNIRLWFSGTQRRASQNCKYIKCQATGLVCT